MKCLSAVLLLGASLRAVQAAVCNENNCYRALFPTRSPAFLPTASSFCSSLLATPTTAPTSYPTRATSACGTEPSKYSSVCSCKVTVTTPTPCPTAYPDDGSVHNGGFECTGGATPYAPWELLLAPRANGRVVGVGAGGSARSFEFSVSAVNPQARYGVGRLLQSVYGLTTGTKYTLNFSLYSEPGGSGFMGITVGEASGSLGCSAGGRTVNVNDSPGPGRWNTFTLDFTANGSTQQVIFELVTSQVGTVFRIDDVSIKKA